MSQEIKKKLYLIVLIFFIFLSGSIYLSIQYDKITEDKWTIVYRLNYNTISLNALQFIKSEMYRGKYISDEENIIKDLTSFINRNSHKDIFDSKIRENIKNIDITINHLKFDISDIENIDNFVNDALFKLNEKIRDQAIEKINYLKSRVAQTVYIKESQEIERLKFRTSNIQTLLNNLENTENIGSLNFIVYNLLSEELSGVNFTNLNEMDLNDLNNKALIKELISYLRLIIQEKEVRLQLLKDYPQRIAKINTDYKKLIVEQENVLKNPFLTIYLKEKLNRKPPKQFIIFGFIVVSLIISILFTYILLYEKILRKVINKKLKAL